MKPDITSRKDIKLITSEFYKKLLEDEKMFPFFKSFIEENTLEEHLEIITDFWEDILFETYKYKNNPMQKHLNFNSLVTFKKEHFSIWTSYLYETIDAFFEGEIAHNMKNRANSIATVMQLKMNLY